MQCGSLSGKYSGKAPVLKLQGGTKLYNENI